MTKDTAELFKKLTGDRLKAKTSTEPADEPAVSVPPETPNISRAKRGRPATGKRSDNNWIGRTFYVRRETDFDVESELLKLKRDGNELDKSELVDALLSAWVKWRQGEDLERQISEISPR